MHSRRATPLLIIHPAASPAANTIILSFLLVFFGIRSYRDNVGQGQITFAKAFGIGIAIAITLISCVFYLATWETLYFNFLPGFMEKYSAHMIQKLRASGASPKTIQGQVQQMAKFNEMYD
ncbi:MAG TPA: DUF4199 domain-containing protein [Terriglobales bacterium]|nr:DUF4199 domain-containing protein [Terriglobales bacterium]